jgi:hypothetical protein
MKRDPVLVLRAQRAAAALELAWDRYRRVHGLGPEPLPQLSSYVGYSFEEPDGQPRVVFGVAADEAEHLAAVLQDHDCFCTVNAEAVPVRQNGTQRPARPTGELPAGGGRVRLPPQSQSAADGPAVADRRALPGTSRGALPPDSSLGQVRLISGVGLPTAEGPRDGSAPYGASAPPDAVPAASAMVPASATVPQLTMAPRHIVRTPVMQSPTAPAAAESAAVQVTPEVQAADPADTGQTGLVAFRPHPAPETYLDADSDTEFVDEPAATAEQAPGVAARSRADRHGMPWLPRQKRAGAHATRDATTSSRSAGSRGPGRQQDGKDGRSLSSMAADLVGWAANELPSQMSQRRSALPGGGSRRANGAATPPDDRSQQTNGWQSQDQVS